MRHAMREMLGYLTAEHGYSTEQAAIIIGVAAEIRATQVVNAPNANVVILLPLDIFSDD